jgi:hypothetical protein
VRAYSLHGYYSPSFERGEIPGTLLYAIRAAEAGDARSASRPAPAPLSMGHISSPPVLTAWIGGLRADFPRIPDLDPRKKTLISPFDPVDHPKRGVVTEFTANSRRRFLRELATIMASEPAYTMALTVPGGDVSTITHKSVKLAFKKLNGRRAAHPLFSGVSGYWKLEVQERGAIHYHLLIYGLESAELRAAFQKWLATQWNALLCASLTPKQTKDHLWWHSRADNMELVRSTAYFAKYVGKSEVAGEMTGRWWGWFNKTSLPKAPPQICPLSDKANVMLHRLARKRRKKQMNEGRHRAVAKAVGLVDFDGNPLVSQFGLLAMRNRLQPKALVAIDLSRTSEIPPSIMEAVIMTHAPGITKQRWGKGFFRGKNPGTAPIIFCDASAPQFANDALAYVSRALHLDLNLHKTPDRSPKKQTIRPQKTLSQRRSNPISSEGLELSRHVAESLS